MTRYILRRLWTSVPVIFVITALTFLFINLAPGDPIKAMLDPEAMGSMSPEALEVMRERLGLNDPLLVRYFKWLGQLLQGNLGYSYFTGLGVRRILFERLPSTLLLMGAATLIALITGIPLGIVSALRQYSGLDYLLTSLSFAGVSVPSFFIALAGLYAFSLKIDIFPTYGMSSRGAENPILDMLHHLILPATVLGLNGTATYMRYVRSSMLEVIHQDYTTTARAKGLSERVVILRHAFRNALIPIVTIMGLQIPRLFGGATVVEMVFARPGMGTVAVNSAHRRDYPMLMGLNLMTALVVFAANLVTDITYAVVDPRIRYD